MNSAHGYSEGAEVPEDKTSDNELIARFMGGVSQKATSYSISDYPNALPPHILKDLKYHKSWDWLVPVAVMFTEKAKNTNMPHAIFMNVWTFSVCRPIEELYKNIITGIKWYNQHKLESLKNKPI